MVNRDKLNTQSTLKTKLHSLFIGLVLLISFLQAQTATAAISFTVTPSAVSNTYIGAITLQIGGLTNGEVVVIKKYLDLNTNGVVDAPDWMVRYFQLISGQTGAMVIGGVTNVNVPFNSSTNTNTITTTLNFQNGQFMETLVAQYLFVVSCASGQVTNSLVVTNSYAQQFTGTVVSGVTPVPNAVVLLLPTSGQIDNAPTPGTVANNSGAYTLQAPAGTYALAAYKTNFVTGVAAMNLTLTNAQTLTTNLSLIAATESISGKVIDAATSNGLPGVLVKMASSSGEAFCYTDTNGNFTNGVTPNQWGVNGEDASVGLLGYVGFNNGVPVNAASGSVPNVIVPENKATALFYGYITNNLGTPLPGFQIEAEDIDNDVYDSFGTADANGYYVTAALGGLSVYDSYGVNIGSDYFLTNYVFSQSFYAFPYGYDNLATNTAFMVNFTGTNLLVPQVTTTTLANGTNGQAYSQQLSAIYGHLPYTWTNSSGTLPPGLTLATSGAISGTPTTNGTFNFIVMVTDTLSATSTQALTLTVVGLPIATLQPANNSVTVTAGSNVTFAVSVSGTGPFSYQWQLNGSNLHNGIINTVAGNGTNNYSGDGGAATNAELNEPYGVAVDAYGNLFIADQLNNRIRKVGTNGIITTVAGGGTNGLGDGGAATNAELNEPYGVAVDAADNLFIADTDNLLIRKVGINGIITTVAGSGYEGSYGDGGAATNAELNYPHSVAVDANGNLYIADANNYRIRKVGTNGIINTVAGNGTQGYSGDGGAATSAELYFPVGVAVDAAGNLYIADNNNRIRKVGTNGIITTFAGNGGNGYYGDGGAATNAELSGPEGVAVDAADNLFIADTRNQRIREVGTNRIITTVAGNGYQNGFGEGGYSGDGGAATNAELSNPWGVAVDGAGDVFIADASNCRIRKVVNPRITVTNSTLLLNDVGIGNTGAYDVVVTSPYGSVTSSVVNLEIALPPLSAPQITGGGAYFSFQLSGPAGSNYVLQVSTNLSNWSSVSTSTIPVSGTITVSNATSSFSHGFYRVYVP